MVLDNRMRLYICIAFLPHPSTSPQPRSIFVNESSFCYRLFYIRKIIWNMFVMSLWHSKSFMFFASDSAAYEYLMRASVQNVSDWGEPVHTAFVFSHHVCLIRPVMTNFCIRCKESCCSENKIRKLEGDQEVCHFSYFLPLIKVKAFIHLIIFAETHLICAIFIRANCYLVVIVYHCAFWILANLRVARRDCHLVKASPPRYGHITPPPDMFILLHF